MSLRLDDQWERINQETNTDGDRLIPVFARHVRTEGGMIVGRVVKNPDGFVAQKYKAGDFVTLSNSASVDEAFKAVMNT